MTATISFSSACFVRRRSDIISERRPHDSLGVMSATLCCQCRGARAEFGGLAGQPVQVAEVAARLLATRAPAVTERGGRVNGRVGIGIHI
jgi:hypothetical protein